MKPAPTGMTFRRLFAWRIRFLARETFQLQTRRWQAVLFVLALSSPLMMPLFQQIKALAAPVDILLSPGHAGVTQGIWIAFLALSGTWACVQPRSLKGGPCWYFLRTLPSPKNLMLRVDLSVLVVSDLPLMLPMVAAIATVHTKGVGPSAAFIVATLLLAAQVPLMQQLVLQRTVQLMLPLVFQCVGLLAQSLGCSLWITSLCLIPGTILALRGITQGIRHVPLLALPSWSSSIGFIRSNTHAQVNLAMIDLRYLLSVAASSRLAALACGLTAPPLLMHFLASQGVRPHVQQALSILLLIPMIFSLSGWVFDLRRMHAPMRALHATQGLSTHAIEVVDAVVLQLIGLVCMSSLTLTLYSSVQTWAALWALPAGLLALLACIKLNQKGDRGVFVPKCVVAAMAYGALIMGVVM